ncbi:MAG: hypothetical protein HYX34_03365 [Actinobacteria bacterium]|nr:hypothetical protein [Actinomycetota bacterium]
MRATAARLRGRRPPARRRGIGAAAVVLALGSGLPASPAPRQGSSPSRVQVVVELGRRAGAAVTSLASTTWNVGDLSAIDPWRPPVVRVTARLDRIAPGPGQLRLDDLQQRLGTVRRMGAEPQLILAPMPTWLGRSRAASCRLPPGPPAACSPSAMAPSRPAAFAALVQRVATAAATGPGRVRRFEAWNEPDLPRFWSDTPQRFTDLAVQVHLAVRAAARSTGLPLVVGGPALSRPGPLVRAYVDATTRAGVPPAFLSWHTYTKDPAELVSDASAVRAQAGPAGARLPLVLDEWSLKGRRNPGHEDNVGAAFALAGLIEMEQAGLAQANWYRSVSYPKATSDPGTVFGDGRRKPVWWVLSTWAASRGNRLVTTGSSQENGRWVRAVRDGDVVNVFLARYRDGPAAKDVEQIALRLDGPCAARSLQVRTIASAGDSWASGRARALTSPVPLPDDSAVWVRADCSPSTPLTDRPLVVALAVATVAAVLVALVVRGSRRMRRRLRAGGFSASGTGSGS